MANPISDQIEQATQLAGQKITVFIKGRLEDDGNREKPIRQASTPKEIYAEIGETVLDKTGDTDSKVTTFYISNSNNYAPEPADKVIINGITLTITSVKPNSVYGEITDYIVEART